MKSVFSCNCTHIFEHSGVITFFVTVKALILSNQKISISYFHKYSLDFRKKHSTFLKYEYLFIQNACFILCCVVKQKWFLTEHEYTNATESLNALCQLRGTATEVLWIIVGFSIIV